VDSGSTDATLAIASRFPVKIVEVKPEDFSFGFALNIGCREASGEVLVFASAHVYPVYEDWLEQLAKPFSSENVGLVYGKQSGNEITKYAEQQVFAHWFPEESDWDQENSFCNNANAAITRELWELHPYDEELTGLEDVAWGKKIKSLGYKIAYNSSAEVIHVHDESHRKVFMRYQREALALKKISPEAHFNLVDFIRFFSANVFSDWVHAAKDNVLFRNIIDIVVFRLMQFSGTYRGFAKHAAITSNLKRKFYYPKSVRKIVKSDEDDNNRRPLTYSKFGDTS